MPDYNIREARVEDAEAMLAYLIDLTSEPDLPILLTRERAASLTLEYEQGYLQGYAESANSIILAAFVGERIIGQINVGGGNRPHNQHRASIGISVVKDWRDQGVGTALMQQALDWARNNPVLTRLELEVFCENERAVHVYQKLGFEIEGRRRHAFFKHGRYIDEYMMGLLL